MQRRLICVLICNECVPVYGRYKYTNSLLDTVWMQLAFSLENFVKKQPHAQIKDMIGRNGWKSILVKDLQRNSTN
jgi:hypothetical protein